MTANERILDREVNHQINVLGFSNRVTRRIIAILNRVDPDLISQVIQARERLPGNQFTVDRLDQLLDNLRRLNAQAYSEVAAELDTELLDLTQAEIDFQVRTISTEFSSAHDSNRGSFSRGSGSPAGSLFSGNGSTVSGKIT